jgi:hypothetical protein
MAPNSSRDFSTASQRCARSLKLPPSPTTSHGGDQIGVLRAPSTVRIARGRLSRFHIAFQITIHLFAHARPDGFLPPIIRRRKTSEMGVFQTPGLMRYVLPALPVSGPSGGAASPAPRGGKTQRQEATGCCGASLPYECWSLRQTQLCAQNNKLQNYNRSSALIMGMACGLGTCVVCFPITVSGDINSRVSQI